MFERLDHESEKGIANGYRVEYSNRKDGSVDVLLNLDLVNEGDKLYTRIFHYRLYLDGKKRVIGGHWLGEDSPEFLWLLDKEVEFLDYYSVIKKLYTPTN